MENEDRKDAEPEEPAESAEPLSNRSKSASSFEESALTPKKSQAEDNENGMPLEGTPSQKKEDVPAALKP